MNEAQALHLIRQQIIRDGRSLLQYTGEAVMYTPPQAARARQHLEAVAAEEGKGVGQLIRFLQRHHSTPPLLGAFPTNFTGINFTSLDHLLPALDHELQQSIAALAHGLVGLPPGEAHHLLTDYLEMKRRHARALHDIARLDAKAEAEHPSVIPGAEPQPAH